MALHQTHRGTALRDRLPNVAALFAAGVVSDLLVRTIVSRTYLIDDAEAMAAVDARAGRAGGALGCVVGEEDRGRHRRLVDEHDPGALRRASQAAMTETVAVRVAERCCGHHDDVGAAELRGCGVDRAARRGDGPQRV